MASETIRVRGIHCDHCKAAIEGALRELAGIDRAEVSVPERTVTVDYDPAVVDLAAIRAAIEEQGYELP